MDWLSALWNWLIYIILLPIRFPMWLIIGMLCGFDEHTKYYSHSLNFNSTNNKCVCGYCGVPLHETDIMFRAYQGNHRWWCFLKRATRNEYIVHLT